MLLDSGQAVSHVANAAFITTKPGIMSLRWDGSCLNPVCFPRSWKSQQHPQGDISAQMSGVWRDLLGALRDNNLMERSLRQKRILFETDFVQNVENTRRPPMLSHWEERTGKMPQCYSKDCQTPNIFGSHKSNIDRGCLRDNAHSESRQWQQN